MTPNAVPEINLETESRWLNPEQPAHPLKIVGFPEGGELFTVVIDKETEFYVHVLRVRFGSKVYMSRWSTRGTSHPGAGLDAAVFRVKEAKKKSLEGLT